MTLLEEVFRMIYEMRIYSLLSGKVPEFFEIIKEGLPAREKYSKLAGSWCTEIGEINQVVNLWAYNDLNHRAQARQAAAQDPIWHEVVNKVTPLLLQVKSSILVPADFSPIR